MAVWYAGQNCIPDGHLHRVIHTRWCIDTIDSPNDEHCVARNMKRNKINTLKCASGSLLTRIKNYTFCPHSLFVCFVFISAQTASFALYDIHCFLQPRWKEFTYAVRNWSSNKKKKIRASSIRAHLAIYYSPVTLRFLHFTLYTVMPCHSIVLRHWTQQIFKF